MSEQDRQQWLSSLRLDDAVCVVKVTTIKSDGYIEEIAARGYLRVGDRWYNAQGIDHGLSVATYRIEPVTPESAAEVQRRQAQNYLAQMKWHNFETADMEKIISLIKKVNIK